ncbi:MAG: patatin-like phospholipase family protein [Geminicoccaceae bacterium]
MTADGDPIPGDGGPVGLALTGGGLKAALFHIGVLARLAELDLLRQVDVISATSGGALVAALYHLRLKNALDADGDIDSDRLIRLVSALEQDFLTKVQTDLRARLFENPLINLKRAARHQSSARRLGDLLDRHLFRPVWNGDPDWPIEMRAIAIQPRGDQDFNPITDNRKRYCKAPALVVNAAVLGAGRAWRFDAERMGQPVSPPAARRLCTAPRLAESPYRHLPEAHAGITLGHAVAASMAAPGLLEPFRLQGLYPDPEQPKANLDVQLADGRPVDAFGADALIDRGCMRLIISDGDGHDARSNGAFGRARALQLTALETARPGGVVLIHMLREIEAPEITPHGPIKHGRLACDRSDDDITSYGIGRGLQKTIAAMRADLDAPSETEAMSLMADGYLITKRTFQQQRQRGLSWTDTLPQNADHWRFIPMIDAFSAPSNKLVKHLEAARFGMFEAPRLKASQAFSLGLLALAAALTMIALAAFWSAFRPAADADRLWLLTTTGVLMLSAWLAGRYLGRSTAEGRIAAWIAPWRAIVTALPLALGARLRRRASRAFLKAGRLKKIGIKPLKIEKRKDEPPKRRTPEAAARHAERKAA